MKPKKIEYFWSWLVTSNKAGRKNNYESFKRHEKTNTAVRQDLDLLSEVVCLGG